MKSSEAPNYSAKTANSDQQPKDNQGKKDNWDSLGCYNSAKVTAAWSCDLSHTLSGSVLLNYQKAPL